MPSNREACAAADRIATRRYEADDQDLDRLDEGLLGVVAYVGRYKRVPEAVRRADVADALVIVEHLRAVLDSAELNLMETGRGAGMTWQELASARGIRSRQGAETAYRRLRNAVRGSGTKDHQRERASRENERALSRWLWVHTGTLRATVQRVNTIRGVLPADVVSDLDELLATIPPPGEPATATFAARLAVLLEELVEGSLPLPPSVTAAVRSAREGLRQRP